jgi:cytosine/adenosine deaminase-related metal-dependent hydrolase
MQYGVEIQIHVQETVYQKLYGLRAWGKTPLEHLNDLDLLGPDVTCAHCVWVTNRDIEILAATGTKVCHLPSSNLRLESGIAPVNPMRAKGIVITIGTDEGGINDDTDMFQEMRLALKIHRVPGMENKPLTGHQVFQMATTNAARNSGFGDSIGSLEAGKRADIVLMKLHNIEEPYLHPDVSIIDAVVQRGRVVDVAAVMIDGEIVFRNDRLIRIDEGMLFQEIGRSLRQPLLPHELERKALSGEIEPYVKRFHAGSIAKRTPPHYYYNEQS